MSGECVLLGAGASVEAELPTSLNMTWEVVRIMEEGPSRSGRLHAVYFALGGLMLGRGQKGLSPRQVDVESLFNAMELLATRETSELAPFVASWNEPEAKMDSFAGKDLAETISSAVGDRHGAMTHGDSLVESIRTIAGGARLPYREAQAEMIRALRSIVWVPDPECWTHLAPLIQEAASTESLTIATLNYDNGVEVAAAAAGIELSTGFELDEPAVTPTFRNDHTVLIKLHGSIDWQRGGQWPKDDDHFGEYSVTRVADPLSVAPSKYEPALVFGGGNKLRAEGPFLDLLTAFRSQLDSSDRLTVIGYSFRDDHVNHLIARWFNGALDREIRVVDPSFAPTWGYSDERRFKSELIAKLRRSDRVSLIEKKTGEALTELWTWS